LAKYPSPLSDPELVTLRVAIAPRNCGGSESPSWAPGRYRRREFEVVEGKPPMAVGLGELPRILEG